MTDLLANAGAHLDALAFRALAATGARALAVAVAGPAGPLRGRVYGLPAEVAALPLDPAALAAAAAEAAASKAAGGAPAPAGGAAIVVVDAGVAVAACATPGADLAPFVEDVRRTYAAALAGRALPEMVPLDGAEGRGYRGLLG